MSSLLTEFGQSFNKAELDEGNIFQFCDVAQVAIIHKNIYSNLAIFQNMKVEKS
jgi:hypothetical protein